MLNSVPVYWRLLKEHFNVPWLPIRPLAYIYSDVASSSLILGQLKSPEIRSRREQKLADSSVPLSSAFISKEVFQIHIKRKRKQKKNAL